jgi:hypothetical protein
MRGLIDQLMISRLNKSQVQPAFVGPEAGQVGCLDLVRRYWREIPLQEVRRAESSIILASEFLFD